MAIRSPKWLILAWLVVLAPDTPGVFELWDDDEMVYVRSTGERGTLRSELKYALLEGGIDATHFSWEITFQPDARSRELLAEFEQQHHRRPRLNS